MTIRFFIVRLMVVVALVSLLLLFWEVASMKISSGDTLTLIAPQGQQRTLSVEVADTVQSRARGLMFREHLKEGRGMLFLFDAPKHLSFWMKDTLIPLDLLFFDSEGRFLDRTTMEPCVSDVCRRYVSDQPARFALEVNRGEPLTADVGEGWTVSLPVR